MIEVYFPIQNGKQIDLVTSALHTLFHTSTIATLSDYHKSVFEAAVKIIGIISDHSILYTQITPPQFFAAIQNLPVEFPPRTPFKQLKIQRGSS